MSFRVTVLEPSSSAFDCNDFTRSNLAFGTVSVSVTGSVWSLSAVAVLTIWPAFTSACVTT